MVIRKAAYWETKEILRHALDVLKEASMGHVAVKREKALQFIAPFLYNGGYYLIYEEDGVKKGWVCIAQTVDHYTDEMVGFIPELFVLPRYRNEGVAKKLCDEAMKELHDQGFEKVQLNVFAQNHAKELYEKLGFYEISTLMEKNIKE
ncbi:GNAT family N-acetyltransferase [Bacillus piscicola]|uniref:GNAT family N-acetyltransferase n=1 Tax=Bacillus piscicola TaxID=1632684 RepID=UPI001F08BBD6|nr:GNAT family N-acetyltransferase [Bacillus piscicola]